MWLVNSYHEFLFMLASWLMLSWHVAAAQKKVVALLKIRTEWLTSRKSDWLCSASGSQAVPKCPEIRGSATGLFLATFVPMGQFLKRNSHMPACFYYNLWWFLEEHDWNQMACFLVDVQDSRPAFFCRWIQRSKHGPKKSVVFASPAEAFQEVLWPWWIGNGFLHLWPSGCLLRRYLGCHWCEGEGQFITGEMGWWNILLSCRRGSALALQAYALQCQCT